MVKKIRINCAYDKLVSPADLKPHPKNPKTITPKRLKQLNKQLIELGFFKPQIVNEDMVLLGGNQRLKSFEALEKYGYNLKNGIPISFFKDKKKENYVVTADNVESGDWNSDINAGPTLGNLNIDLEDDVEDSSGGGSGDSVPDIPEEPVTKRI